jgi:signal transduction histidine kinase
VLNLSRISTRGQPFEAVDLQAIVADVLRDLETTIEQQGGTVEVSTLPTLAADPVQMRQLFQNLIGNALKFHEAGTAPFIKITSRLEHGESAAYPIYAIAVADHGIGFEEKYVDRIFQPFQRLHGAQRYEGTGMGLAICRRIVERHGGAIRATSQPGLGATFTISLPRAPANVRRIDRCAVFFACSMTGRESFVHDQEWQTDYHPDCRR